MRRHLILVLKLAASAGLIAVIAIHVDATEVMSSAGRLALWIVFAAAIPLALQIPIQALRWRAAAVAMGLELPSGQAVLLNWIGMFFNQVLPSSVGGDAVRAWYLGRLGGGFATALGSVLLDRLAALLALLAIILAGLPLLRPLLAGQIAFWPLPVVVFTVFAGTVVILRFGSGLARMLYRFRWLRFAGDLVDHLARALPALWRNPRLLAYVLFSHALTVSAMFTLALSVDAGLSYRDAVLCVPLIILTMALPFSFAGWGLREGTTIVVLGLADVAAADALVISVTFGLLQLLISLPGLLLWLVRRGRATYDRQRGMTADRR